MAALTGQAQWTWVEKVQCGGVHIAYGAAKVQWGMGCACVGGVCIQACVYASRDANPVSVPCAAYAEEREKHAEALRNEVPKTMYCETTSHTR